jgi:hypothetical protein
MLVVSKDCVTDTIGTLVEELHQLGEIRQRAGQRTATPILNAPASATPCYNLHVTDKAAAQRLGFRD